MTSTYRFIFHADQTRFHMKGFARRLTLKQKHKETFIHELAHKGLWFFLPFTHLLLTSLSSTPLHYEVQLRITPPKIIFILLDSFVFQKIYITIYLFECLTYVACCTKTCIACVSPWWIKGGLIYSFLPIASTSICTVDNRVTAYLNVFVELFQTM